MLKGQIWAWRMMCAFPGGVCLQRTTHVTDSWRAACTSASLPPVVRTQEQDGTQLKVYALVNRVLVSRTGNTVTYTSDKIYITRDVICNI